MCSRRKNTKKTPLVMDLLKSLLYICNRISAWLHRKPKQNDTAANVPQDGTSSDAHGSSQTEKKDLELGRRRLNKITFGRAKTDEEDLLTENRELKARLTQLEGVQKEVKDLMQQLEHQTLATNESRKQHERALDDAQQLRTRFMHLDSDAKRSAAIIADLQRAQTQAQAERRSALALLDTRTAELREARSFLTKEDDIEDSEVIHIVELLNARIVKTAATVVTSPQFRFDSRSEDPVAAEKAYRRIEHYGWLSPSILAALRAIDHTEDYSLVRTALQAGMVMYARWLASSWEFGVLDPRALLENVYLRIREGEPQSVSGRWRALCRSHVKELIDTGETQTQRLFKTLSGVVADILVVSSVADTWEHVSEAVARDLEKDLHEILNLALQFQWTAGERVISRNLVASVGEPDAAFDPVRMIDENTEFVARKALVSYLKGGSVLCTTQLGLMSERHVNGAKAGTGTFHSTTLLKPRVILKTVLAGLPNQ